MRRYLKIKIDTKVFIYVGGMQNYQKFPETIEFFNDIKNNKNTSLIVLTNNVDKAKFLFKNEDHILVKNVEFKDVNKYLNASDFGLLIREANNANHPEPAQRNLQNMLYQD